MNHRHELLNLGHDEISANYISCIGSQFLSVDTLDHTLAILNTGNMARPVIISDKF